MDMEKTDELAALREKLRSQRPVAWDQLPDFPLYMDQVLSYMERQVFRFEEGDGLTAAMVNNYTKNGLAPRAEGKKYTREHLAYLTVICILKRVMSSREIDLTLSAQLADRGDVANGYEAFRGSLDKAMGQISELMDQYDDATAADAAVHFALLSYAAGVASSHYLRLLQQLRDGGEPAAESKTRAKPKKEAT